MFLTLIKEVYLLAGNSWEMLFFHIPSNFMDATSIIAWKSFPLVVSILGITVLYNFGDYCLSFTDGVLGFFVYIYGKTYLVRHLFLIHDAGSLAIESKLWRKVGHSLAEIQRYPLLFFQFCARGKKYLRILYLYHPSWIRVGKEWNAPTFELRHQERMERTSSS